MDNEILTLIKEQREVIKEFFDAKKDIVMSGKDHKTLKNLMIRISNYALSIQSLLHLKDKPNERY